MRRQRNLNKILKYLSLNDGHRLRPDDICKNAGVTTDKKESYLMLDFLATEGYVARTNENQAFYSGKYKGTLFLDNGGYVTQHRHYRRQIFAQTISDYVDIVVKPLGILTAIMIITWTTIQILNYVGILHSCINK